MRDLFLALKGIEERLQYRRRIGGRRIPMGMAKGLSDLLDDLEGERHGTGPKYAEALEQISLELRGCTRCELHRARRSIVLGEGNPRAEVLFVGEGPGEEEDQQGRPFVGPAGQLLTRIIEAMGLRRQDVFTANVVKCRPPGNRRPQPEEVAACSPFLFRQLGAISPKVICAMGTVAAQTLLGRQARISTLRGQFHRWQEIAVMPTYHPSYLLRNPEKKREVWEDMKRVMGFLSSSEPSKG